MDRAFYSEIKKILTNARDKVYQTANFTMVEAYWQIGKSIVKDKMEKNVPNTEQVYSKNYRSR